MEEASWAKEAPHLQVAILCPEAEIVEVVPGKWYRGSGTAEVVDRGSGTAEVVHRGSGTAEVVDRGSGRPRKW